MYMDKQVNGLTIPGNPRDWPPFAAPCEGHPREVNSAIIGNHTHPELNAPSWHSPQDERDELTILSSTAELCFGALSNITAPIASKYLIL